MLVRFEGNRFLLPKRRDDTYGPDRSAASPASAVASRELAAGRRAEVDGTHVAGGGSTGAARATTLRWGELGRGGTLGQAATDPPKKSKVTVTDPPKTPTETYDPKKKPKDIGVDSNGVALDAVTTANVAVGNEYGFVGCVLKNKANGLRITDYDATAKLDPKRILIPKNATKKLIAHENGHVTINDTVFKAVARTELITAFAGFVGMEFAPRRPPTPRTRSGSTRRWRRSPRR